MKINSVTDFIANVTRYILGITMMSYGLIKILQIQFVLPPEVYQYPLNQLDGVTLTWAFLGFSTWVSTLLGVFELISGLLLLFNITKLFGSILLFPALLVIFLINIGYDFLPQMKVFTGTLFLLDVLLLYVYRSQYISFLKDVINQNNLSLKEFIANGAILVLITFLIIYFLL